MPKWINKINVVKVVFLEMFQILLRLIKRRNENCCGQSAVYNPIEIFLDLSFSLSLSISLIYLRE